MCEQHDEKEIEFWCEDDDKVFCATCAIVSHRSCSRVLEISDTTNIERQAMRVSKRRIEVLKTHLDDVVTVYNKYKQTIVKDIDSIRKQVEERKARLMKTIETEISQLLSFSSNKGTEYSGSVERNLSILKDKIKQLERSITVTEKCSGMVQGKKRDFIVRSRLQRLVTDYKQDVDEIFNETKPEFSRVRLSKETSEHNPEYFIGMLEEYTGTHVFPEAPEFKPMRDKGMLAPAFGMDGCAKKVCKVGSYYTSCDFFTDSVSVFSDKKNRRIVKYNHTNKEVCGEIKTKPEPWTVRVLKKMIVVSFPSNTKIIIYDENLRPMNSFSTTNGCYSFADLYEHNVLVCEETSECVVYVTYDLGTGERKNRIDPDGDGNKLVTNSHICVDNNILYRLSEQTNSAIALNLDDKAEVFEYKNRTLDCPTGIDVDVEGNIYVCGIRSKNIHMLDKDGDCIRVFDLEQYGFRPTFIKFSRNEEDLILLGDANKPGPFFFKLKLAI